MRSFSSVAHRAAAAALGLVTMVANPAPGFAEARLVQAVGRTDLVETHHALDVAIRGQVAKVRASQTIANPGTVDAEAIYTFDLPLAAVVTGMSVRLANGRVARGRHIDAAAALRVVPDVERINAAPDVGLLRLIETSVDEDRRRYELRVYPVEASNRVSVHIDWVQPLTVVGGRFRLRLPDRGDAGNLSREAVSLTVHPPRGARGFSGVWGGGQRLSETARAGARFRLNAPVAGELVVDVQPAYRRIRAQVDFATVSGTAGGGTIIVSAVSPLRASSQVRYERVVIGADVSRSMGTEGLDASADAVSRLLAEVSPTAEVEAVVFDREARRVLGKWRRNNSATRTTIDVAIRRGALRNGSDLAAALALIRGTIGDDDSRQALVVVISDGLVALELDADDPVYRIAQGGLGRADVIALTLAPPGTPAPAPDSALTRLLETVAGRAVAAEHPDASLALARVLRELGQPPPVSELRLQASSQVDRLQIDLPTTLHPGTGFVAVGHYTGAPPRTLALVGRAGNRSVLFRGRRAGPGVTWASRLRDDEPSASGGVVNPGVVHVGRAMIALDPADGFARDRLALVDKWGEAQFARVPPPAERLPGHSYPAYSEVTAAALPARSVGSLDRTIARRLIRTHVLPRARNCYNRALRKDRDLRGSMTLVVDLARGEVLVARLEASNLAPSTTTQNMHHCVLEAAYSIRVPAVGLGDELETISRIRYPLAFSLNQTRQRRGHRARRLGLVEVGRELEEAPRRRRSSDPLEGIPTH